MVGRFDDFEPKQALFIGRIHGLERRGAFGGNNGFSVQIFQSLNFAVGFDEQSGASDEMRHSERHFFAPLFVIGG